MKCAMTKKSVHPSVYLSIYVSIHLSETCVLLLHQLTMHANSIVYVSLSYFVWFLFPCLSVHIIATCQSLHVLSLKRSADSDRPGCCCEVAVTPWIKNTLSSPMAPKRTLKNMNKGTKVLHRIFFPHCKTSVYWKGFWQLSGLLSCLEGPWSPASQKENPTSTCCCPAPKTPTTDPPLFVFVIVNNRDKLPMINNIALTSTPLLPEWFCFYIQYNFLCL